LEVFRIFSLSLNFINIVEIPIEKKVAGLEKRQLFYSTTSPSILFEFFKNALTKFDREYWSTHCG
jgi:hypothetical protein